MTAEKVQDKEAALTINRIISEINHVNGDMSYILYIGHKQMRALHRIGRFDGNAFKDNKFLEYRVIVINENSYLHLARMGLVVLPYRGPVMSPYGMGGVS